jgi:hypothetical protein
LVRVRIHLWDIHRYYASRELPIQEVSGRATVIG